ncbi:hypothetical protein BU16DRAFT_577798 [Lophium mytilinum]|uniref:NAD(P)-binding protein n=1 Tax=Lophium mytilinum TaxID=390894 RepID=A0A6A6RDA4_9PEZI|nr:hypothetical protein BU16DRAFT_577798 [Lophium mytilinum]
MTKPILLVLGAGANIGAALTTKFSAAGYRIALAARSLSDGLSSAGHLNIKIDLTDPTAIPTAFSKVKKEFGTPNIVIYNAANVSAPPDPQNMFSIETETLDKDVKLMTISAYAAAKEAVAGFESLGTEQGRKAFIYTGNILNTLIMSTPYVLTLGVGKAGSAYWIGTASELYKDKGIKFYYADERTPEGASKGVGIDGPAHADFYFQLATEEVSVPWDATFVAGKGYTKF